MPRKGEVPKRRPLPDPKYTDQPVDTRRKVSKFVNTVMESGKKAVAERIVYGAFDLVAEKATDDPVKVWDRALSNVQPKLEVKSRRVGGATYQVPVDVRPDRALALGMAHPFGPRALRRPHHAGEAGRRDPRCLVQQGFRREEAGGHPQDGRGQQSICALPLVVHSSAKLNIRSVA
jgi:ribosomal protein S7